jgi:integrase
LACLKSIYTKAIEWEKASHNPMKKVKLFRESNAKERVLCHDEMNCLIKAASSHIKSILIIALNTGMRRNEILSLKWGNIDFAKKYIYIEDSKNGKSRKVPINQMVMDALCNIDKSNEWVFYNHYTNDNIKDIKTGFKAACRRAGIDNLRLHDLRHTAATKMIEAGVDLVTVSKILGHSSIQMTMRYAHPTPENMQRAVNILGEIFRDSSRMKMNLLHDKSNKERFYRNNLYN